VTEALTAYERLDDRRNVLRWRAYLPPGVVAASVCFLVGLEYWEDLGPIGAFILLLPIFVVGFVISRKALEAAWPWYALTVTTLRDIESEIGRITRRVRELYDSVPQRPFRARFKTHYELTGKRVVEFEKTLVVGMRQERKEVWVAAFCKGNAVVRVTATIGSAFRCRPSDDVRQWSRIARNLGCTEIRQYHNHPGHYRRTKASSIDIQTSRTIQEFLPHSNICCRFYIVFWNEISEHRIVEFNGDGTQELVQVFDGAA